MRSLQWRSRLLVAIGAGSAMAVSCGGSDTAAQGDVDASSDTTAADTSAADTSETSSASDSGHESATDAPPYDVVADDGSDDTLSETTCARDTSSDVCAPFGAACSEDGDCCPGIPCVRSDHTPCAGACGCTCYVTVRRPFLVGSKLRTPGVAA